LTANGTVLVTDPSQNQIVRFDAAGNLLGTWPVADGPLGIAAHPDGRYFVSLRDVGKVAIYDASFSFQGYLGAGDPQVTFVRPTDIDVASDTGNIYVVDAEADKVYGFSPAGARLLKFGSRGGNNGQFRYPSAIAVDEPRGRLIVADHDNFRIQVFTTAGAHRLSFGARNKYPPGAPAEGWVPRTQGLAVDATGRIYVADAMMSTVRLFDSTGKELSKLLQYGSAPGDLRTPCDIALNSAGTRYYVVSTNTSSVEIHEPQRAVPLPKGAAMPRTVRPPDELHDPRSATSAFETIEPLLDWNRSPFDDRGPGPRTTYTGPHFVDSSVTCGRCHGIRSQPGGDETTVEGQAVLCVSCHTAGGQGMGLPIHELEAADPYASNPHAPDGRGRSHAWWVAAVNPLADSVGPSPGGQMAQYLENGEIKCATCHNTHNSDAGWPYLRVSNAGDGMCKECHAPRNEGLGQRGTHPVGFDYPGGTGEFPDDASVAPLCVNSGNVECTTCHAPHGADSGGVYDGAGDGMLLRAANDDTLCRTCHTAHTNHAVAGARQPGCRDCHDVHDPASTNLSLVSRSINGTPISFQTDTPGLNDFIHSDHDPVSYDGVCEVCHTGTAYHRNNPSGDHSHYAGQVCTTCHPHNAGFMPTGGSCTDCHGQPQDNGDGVPAGGRRAITGEFPVSNAHAHYGAALDGAACVLCHSMTTHMDGYVDLIDPDDANHIFRFVKPGDLTQDPDVSDFCAHCHDANGASRLPAPLDPFGNGNQPPDVAARFQGTLAWSEWTGDYCVGEEGTLRAVNSHHDISSTDQAVSGAKLECLNCHGAHTAAASQKTTDPFNPTTPWIGTGNAFCLSCHNGGTGPASPGFPADVTGPTVPLRGIDSCEYDLAPWWVSYTWTHSAHGPDSKRAWPGYSGGPAYDLPCMDCHDPHGSYTPANPTGNPYMIRDFVDGTGYVDDGYRYSIWSGPPWTTFGTARSVVVPVSGTTVGWGSDQGLCAVCHPTWLATLQMDWWHDYCTACQICHSHGGAWGEYDWEGGDHDTPCPSKSMASRPPAHQREAFPLTGGPVLPVVSEPLGDDGSPGVPGSR
jgi:DNA-binding beta-propeller fold protein YncE